MELKDFSKDTIKAIAEATTELQDELGPQGILVNPPTNGRDHSVFVEGDKRFYRRPVKDVEFDVALTVEKSGSGSAVSFGLEKRMLLKLQRQVLRRISYR